ncbi:CKLF-like MARVEL transmembrane domain-containing protein 2B [Lepus europaeus]|uniref:CKLF-like MARVEL transmembrane domain-containing protein 2B n=1 Tax=Lepus europaeus TaxID=9983 RepID=UPI002B4622D3|nr:CKLF-like MARVEL transmembrane domain-containing protein 2B [Lepus europaeus]
MDPENTKPGLSSSSSVALNHPPSARRAQPTPLVGAARPAKEAVSGMPRRSFSVHHKASEHTPHSVPSASVHPVPSASSATSVRPGRWAPAAPSAPARPGKGPAKSRTPRDSMYLLLAGPPGPKKAEVKKAIQKRAKGRAKVPHKFRDSFKNFFFSPTGMLKILRMSLIVAAAVCFLSASAPESYIAVTILEACLVIFFILIYLLALQHLLTYIHWPLLDLINSIISALFLLIVGLLVMEEKDRRNLLFIGGTLCLVAAALCLIDAVLVTKKTRDNIKRLLADNEESKHTVRAPLPRHGRETARRAARQS